MRSSAATRWSGLRRDGRKSGSSGARSALGASATASSAPSATRPSMTPAEHWARAASAGFRRRRVALGQRRQHARARLRHARRRLAGRDEAEFRRRRLGDFAGADRHAQHHAARAERPAGHPVDEIAQAAARSGGQSRTSAIDFRLSPPPGRVAQTTPVAMPRAERHRDESAGFELKPWGRAIAIGGVDRDRDEHVDDDALGRCVSAASAGGGGMPRV